MRSRSRPLGLAALLFALPGAGEAQLPLTEWVVDAEPFLQVGALEGADGELFVQVVDAARLPDGGLVVADYRAAELRFFDGRGALVAVGGGEGEGPGEFKGLLGVEVLRGDSVVAWDYARGVISYWSPDGEHLTEKPARWAITHEGELLADGSVVVPHYADEPTPPAGKYRPMAILARHTFAGDRELGPFPYNEMLAGAFPVAMPYASRSAVAAGGDPLRIFVGDDTNAPTVRVYDEGGNPQGDWALHDGRERVSRAHWDALLDAIRASGGQTPGLERLFTDWGRPQMTPAFDDLAVDAEGRLWALRTEGDESWAIVHAEGEPVARAHLPTLDVVYEIGSDYVLGLHLDALGVQSVRAFRFEVR